MGLVTYTAPTVEPVSVSEAKDHLRISTSSEDTYIGELISGARAKTEALTNRSIPQQTWELWWDIPPVLRAIRLPRPPLQSVTHIKYYSTTDVEAVYGSINYFVDTSNQQGGRISLTEGSAWPSDGLRYANAIVTRFVAGYTTVPFDLKHAIKMLVAHWFENREAINVGNIVSELPLGFNDLIWPYKVFSL